MTCYPASPAGFICTGSCTYNDHEYRRKDMARCACCGALRCADQIYDYGDGDAHLSAGVHKNVKGFCRWCGVSPEGQQILHERTVQLWEDYQSIQKAARSLRHYLNDLIADENSSRSACYETLDALVRSTAALHKVDRDLHDLLFA